MKYRWRRCKVIDRLSQDIRKEFPKLKGFSTRNLKYMQKFASYFPKQIIESYTELWNNMGKTKFVQHPTAQIQSIDLKKVKIVQEVTAQLDEQDLLASPISKLTWTHHMVLMNKLQEHSCIFWYTINTIEHGNSSNILKMQIESGLYERQVGKKKISNFSQTLPSPQSDFANYLLKDPYIFDFVQAKVIIILTYYSII